MVGMAHPCLPCMVRQTEAQLCEMIARFMRIRHPRILFHFDYGSGLKMTQSQAIRQKRLNAKSWPDLFVAASAKHAPYRYGGLFIELKREGTRLKKRDGSWSSDHIAEQADVLELLARQGFIAQFACGYDEALELIESYLA